MAQLSKIFFLAFSCFDALGAYFKKIKNQNYDFGKRRTGGGVVWRGVSSFNYFFFTQKSKTKYNLPKILAHWRLSLA